MGLRCGGFHCNVHFDPNTVPRRVCMHKVPLVTGILYTRTSVLPVPSLSYLVEGYVQC